MEWGVEYHDEYWAELQAKPVAVQVAIIAHPELLRQFGPQLGRPRVDTLKGSAYPNMKELRITLPDGEWRVAFAFDPKRRAILLNGGSKSGISQRKFYHRLISISDKRNADHLMRSNENGD